MAKFENNSAVDQIFRPISERFNPRPVTVRPGQVIEVDEVDAAVLRRFLVFTEVKD